MAVVIDEMITEPPASAQDAGAPAAGGGGASAEPDLDKLAFQIRRARQRSARLFAD
ncbi:MAG TPA: hypothetical protein VGF77_12480 [Allosphingosinicella sp.]|jgi:hypothetical protein